MFRPFDVNSDNRKVSDTCGEFYINPAFVESVNVERYSGEYGLQEVSYKVIVRMASGNTTSREYGCYDQAKRACRTIRDQVSDHFEYQAKRMFRAIAKMAMEV